MDYLNRKWPKPIYFLVTLILLFALNLTGLVNPVKSNLNRVFTPTIFYSERAGRGMNDLFSALFKINSLRKKYDKVAIENATLKAQNSQVRLLVEENDALKSQLNLGKGEHGRLVEAFVLSTSEQNSSGYLIVNRGSSDGIKAGDIALIGNLYIGKVNSVEERSSKIALPYLVTQRFEALIFNNKDKNLNVDQLLAAVSEGSVFKALVSGDGSLITISNINNDSIVEQGDSVVLNDSKVGQPLYIGSIIEVTKSNSSVEQSGTLLPAINYEDINYLFIQLSNE